MFGLLEFVRIHGINAFSGECRFFTQGLEFKLQCARPEIPRVNYAEDLVNNSIGI